MKRALALALAAVAGAAGCVTIDEIRARTRDTATAEVKKRAAFELACESELDVAELNALHLEGNDWVGTFGVDGCGKRLVYIVTCHGLYQDNVPCTPVLNSESK